MNGLSKLEKKDYTTVLIINKLLKEYPNKIDLRHLDLYEDFSIIYDDVGKKKFASYFRESVKGLNEKKIISISNNDYETSKNNTLSGSGEYSLALNIILKEAGLEKIEKSSLIKIIPKDIKKGLVDAATATLMKKAIDYIFGI